MICLNGAAPNVARTLADMQGTPVNWSVKFGRRARFQVQQRQRRRRRSE